MLTRSEENYSMAKVIDTKTIIVNLLKVDQKTYLSVKRLQELIHFIYLELKEKNMLESYQISFDINFDAIERTVLYNNRIFDLDIDGEMIYLRESESLDQLARRYQTDNTIFGIIKVFGKGNVA